MNNVERSKSDPKSDHIHPSQYIQYQIPKKKGFRTITKVTDPELIKEHDFLLNVLNKIKPHKDAAAYVKSKSIQHTAYRHVDFIKLIKLDFTDFFGSISFENVKNQLVKRNFSEEIIDRIQKKCFINNKLPQGFSTSPALSNLAMNSIDKAIVIHLNRNLNAKILYSRYADDIIISYHFNSLSDIKIIKAKEKKETLMKMEKNIQAIISKSNASLKLNQSKSRIFCQPQQAHVLGHVLQPMLRTKHDITTIAHEAFITTGSYSDDNEVLKREILDGLIKHRHYKGGKMKKVLKDINLSQFDNSLLNVIIFKSLQPIIKTIPPVQVTISRKKRRVLRAMKHQATHSKNTNQNPNEKQEAKIKGLETFCKATKPKNVDVSSSSSIKRKYFSIVDR